MTERPPEPRRAVLERLAALGASAQAAIPGLYAWAITVAPCAWAREASILAKVVALLGPAALFGAPVIEGVAFANESASNESEGAVSAEAARLASRRARLVSVWGLSLSSAVVWALVPGAASSLRFDAVRGALGTIGWALFAFASAGPVLRRDPRLAERVVAASALKPRSSLPQGDGLYLAAGIVLALGLQCVGWGVVAPERAVLVRLVTLLCGVALVGATTQLALARHGARAPRAARLRLRRALPWLLVLVVIGAGLAVRRAR